MSTTRDIVLFLGAGFSRTAGLPTMAEFGDKSVQAHHSLTEKHRPKSTDPRAVFPLFDKAAQAFRDFQDYCRLARIAITTDVENMEVVFCIAEALQQARHQTIEVGTKTYQLEDLIENIKLWLWKIYQECPPLARNKPGDDKPYKKLMRTIKDGGNDLLSRMAVITTNYDLIFEYYAYAARIKCTYPLKRNTDYVPLIVADNGQSAAMSQPYLEYDDRKPAPLVCKLHGSINFFELGNSATLGIADGDSSGIARLRGRPKPKPPGVFALDAIRLLREQYESLYGSLTPAIVPPTYAKLKRHEWLTPIWTASRKALSEAKTIIFIGYSLPESDGFMHAMIQGAMAARSRKLPLQIYVLDPCEATQARYKRLFQPLAERLVIRGYGFATACDNGDLGDAIRGAMKR